MDARNLLALIFDTFPPRAIGQNGEPIVRGSSLEAEQIAGEFYGLTWPSLIAHHSRSDPNLESSAFLTNQTFLKVLPSYLCSALLWESVDMDVLVRKFLARSSIELYEFLRSALSSEQQQVVRAFLLFAAEDENCVELGPGTQTDRQAVASSIDRYWPTGK